MENVRNTYGSENLDRIFRYFMWTVLRMEKSGLLSLPVETTCRVSLCALIWTWP